MKLAWDGNSLVAGVGASGGLTVVTIVQTLLQAIFSDVISTNLGISSQTWRNMDGLDGSPGNGSSDVDGAYDGSRTNILILWETTNSVSNALRTAAQTAADAQSYITNRLTAHPGWKIIVLGTLPRQGGPSWTGASQSTIDSYNGILVATDALIRDNLRSWGAKAFVDLRCPGSPFRYADYAASTFARDGALWNEAAGNRIHLTNAGYSIIAGLVARAVLNLSAR